MPAQYLPVDIFRNSQPKFSGLLIQDYLTSEWPHNVGTDAKFILQRLGSREIRDLSKVTQCGLELTFQLGSSD